MTVIRDVNISSDLEAKLGTNVWWRPQIDKKELKKLSIRKTWPGIFYTGLYFIALIFFAYLTYRTWGTAWGILSIWLYASVYAFSGAYDHESRHRTLFKQRWLNDFFNYIFSFMTDFEPVRWRWSHTLHHSYTLHTNEPQDFEIQVDRPSQLAKFYLFYVPFGPLLWIHKSYLKDTLMCALGFKVIAIEELVPKEHHWKVYLSSRIHMLIWIGVIAWSLLIKSWLPFLMICAPMFYGQSIFYLCALTQHAGLKFDVKDHRLSTRTVLLNPILSWLYVKLEYHIEHHMFPQVPWYNLPKLHELIKDQLPPRSKGLLAAYKEIIPTIHRQAFEPSYSTPRDIPS